MIPTIGRILLFTPPATDLAKREPDARLAAIVSQVNADGTVNLGVFDGNGHPIEGGYRFVPILAEGAEKPEHGSFCEWPVIAKPAPADPQEYPDADKSKPADKLKKVGK